MNIDIRHGRGNYCGITCDQIDEFLNGAEMIVFGTDLLDPAIELISNGQGEEIEEAVALLDRARDILLRIDTLRRIANED